MAHKSIIFLIFLFGITQNSKAQGKPEFGFVAGIGNFMLPAEKNEVRLRFSDFWDHVATSYNPGTAYFLGLWHTLKLNSKFQLSWELLYRNQLHSIDQVISLRQIPGVLINTTSLTLKYYQHSISIPVKLQYYFKKNGKFSIELGTGVSRSFLGTYNQTQVDQFTNFPSETRGNTIGPLKWENYTYQILYAAGVQYRIDRNTSLGLGFTFEKTADFIAYNQGILHPPLSDCLCFEKQDGFHPNMQNFSVSLRHNILSNYILE